MKKHVINKVSIRLPASGYENARKLQQNAQNWSSRYLPGLLENSLNKLGKNGDYLFIDKIEIDLSEYPWQLSDEEWLNLLGKKLSEHQIARLPAETVLKQWVFYLLNGAFERNAVIGKTGEIEHYFLEGNLKFTKSEMQILARLFSSEIAIRRFFMVHSERFARFVLEHFFVLKKETAVQFYHRIKNQLVLNQQATVEAVKKLNRWVIQNEMDVKEKWIEAFLQNRNTTETDEIFEQKRKRKENQDIEKEEPGKDVLLHCKNAGLVLLLPFIKPFFENLQLVTNDAFTRENEKFRACNILHFLATGKTAVDEQELLLPKILCGIEIQEIVEPVEIDDERVKTESDDLLKSMIQHWAVLKGTSVESLRETFLQRDGQLKIESSFLLQVSNSGVDILLSKLPWGFRNYKLPWMQKSIITEWE